MDKVNAYNQLFDTIISALLLYMVKCKHRSLLREVFFHYEGKPIKDYTSIESPRRPDLFINTPKPHRFSRKGSNISDIVISIQPSWLKKLLTRRYGGKEVEDISAEIDRILESTNDDIISTYLGVGGSGGNRDVFGSFCELAIKKIGQHTKDSNIAKMYNSIIDCYCSLQLLINNNNIILRNMREPVYDISNQPQSDLYIESVLNTITNKLTSLHIRNIDNLLLDNYTKLHNKFVRKCEKICKCLSIEISNYPQYAQDIISDLNTVRINCSKATELGSNTFSLVTNMVINEGNRQLYYYWMLRYWLLLVISL